jgi:hypothetical protein
MTDIVSNTVLPRSRRFHFGWVMPALFKPRSTFAEIANQNRSVWLTPILILTLTGLLLVGIIGPIKQQVLTMGGLPLPQDFEYWGPEQQAQFMRAAEATQSPVFIYVFPALTAVASVWVGWLLVSGILHLALTLLGGRGSTSAALNVVAWASLPFALRDLVRSGSTFFSKSLIQQPGISGFLADGKEFFSIFLSKLAAQVDLYLFWHLFLLVLGLSLATNLKRSKTFWGVLFTLLFVLSMQALIGYAGSFFTNLTVSRPFFF